MKVFVDKSLYTIDKPYFEPSSLDPANAGLDLRVVEVLEGTLKNGRQLEPKNGKYTLHRDKIYTINSAIKVEIPSGYVGLVGLRSSSMQAGIKVPAMGVIDSNYRGFIYCTTTYNDMVAELAVTPSGQQVTYYDESLSINIEQYARIHQLIVVPYYKIVELVDSVEALSATDRGEAGHGQHTGTSM